MTLALAQIALSEAAVEANLKQLETWVSDLDALMVRLVPRFKRAELRARAKEYVQGIVPRCVQKLIIWVSEPYTEGLSPSDSKQR